MFPDAIQNSAKQNNGKCWTNFVYEEKSNEKFPPKKDELVCHEHRQKNKNQQKERETRTKVHPLLHLFLKDLKLKFHINQQQFQYHLQSSSQVSEIYILQIIKALFFIL